MGGGEEDSVGKVFISVMKQKHTVTWWTRPCCRCKKEEKKKRPFLLSLWRSCLGWLLFDRR